MGPCTDGTKTWAQIDTELQGANYPGPFDHSTQEIGAYQRAAGCTPQIAGYNVEATATPPAGGGSVGGGGGVPSATGGTGGATASGITAWITQNPLLAVGGAVVVAMMLGRK